MAAKNAGAEPMADRFVVIRISQAGGGAAQQYYAMGGKKCGVPKFKISGYYASHCVCTRINVYVDVYNHK